MVLFSNPSWLSSSLSCMSTPCCTHVCVSFKTHNHREKPQSERHSSHPLVRHREHDTHCHIIFIAGTTQSPSSSSSWHTNEQAITVNILINEIMTIVSAPSSSFTSLAKRSANDDDLFTVKDLQLLPPHHRRLLLHRNRIPSPVLPAHLHRRQEEQRHLRRWWGERAVGFQYLNYDTLRLL